MLEQLDTRGIYPINPPDPKTKEETNPTLLVSWWATLFSVTIILTRLCGRYIRIEHFFPEDKVMMASVIPLMIRMAFVHVVLIYGTNNVKTAGLTAEDIRQREIGSKLVLASRIFYAIFIWTVNLTVALFLKRVTGMIWRRSLERFLQFLYFFLAFTLIAVVIATLAECQPFDHHWQVVPDPGAQCRSGYANLITMGICDVVTDMLLVAFPIPIILMTHMSVQRKASLVALFALSLIPVGFTCYRVPMVVFHSGSQQYRSLLASLEILIATVVSNALVINSFVRDKGVKKLKFQKALGSASVSESVKYTFNRHNAITHHQWGSDSALAGELGMRVDPKLCSNDEPLSCPGPATPLYPHTFTARTGKLVSNWSFNNNRNSTGTDDISTGRSDVIVNPNGYIETTKSPRKSSSDVITIATHSARRVSIFDIGGCLDPKPSTSLDTSPPHLNDNHPSEMTTTADLTRHPSHPRTLSSQDPNTATQSNPQHPPHISTENLPRPGVLLLPRRTSTSTARRRSSNVRSDETDSPVPSYWSQPEQVSSAGAILEDAQMEDRDVEFKV